MPSASIRSKVNGINPITGSSRDDLSLADVVTVESVNVHTNYSWSIAFKPQGSAATFSGSALAQNPGTFTVDLEGSYLIRLIADLALPTESTQFVRLRFLTIFGDLKLVAAGESYNGVVPVPVDATSHGWADEQNFNLKTLLDLVARVSTSGSIFSVDPTPGFGDYNTIQEAIDAAVLAGASGINPFAVLVRSGVYVEDLTFAPFVYVIGWPGTPADVVGFPLVLVRGSHLIALPGGSDNVIIAQMTFAGVAVTTDPAMHKTGAGAVTFHQCSIEQDGVSPTQGAALQVDAGNAYLVECSVVATSALPDDRTAISQPSQSTLVMERCSVIGPTGLVLNTSNDSFVVTELIDTTVTGQAVTGFGIVSDATGLLLRNAQVVTTNSVSITVHPSGGAFTHDQNVEIRNSLVTGQIIFDKTGITGNTILSLGSSEYGTLSFPGGALTVLAATTMGTSLFYDNTSSGLAAVNVQDAIDEAYTAAVLVRTLDDAYDGGVPNSGSGRIIIADQGSVQILDAPVPSDPPPAGSTDGRLEVLSGVQIGAIGFDEISLEANPFGSGPVIEMGQRVIPPNIPFGVGTALVMARSTGTPLFRNYNLRLHTESSDGGGEIGRLVLGAGDGLANGGSTPDGGPVYIEAGSAFGGAATPGDVFILPGKPIAGSQGALVLAKPTTATPATLTGAGVAANPIGVTGTVTFATNMGAVTASFNAVDSRATVVSKIDALLGISAAQSLGVITITTDHLGPTAEVYFLQADAGIDAALGGFDGQAQVDGAYVDFVRLRATDAHEISIGQGGVAGPLVYNGDTGKLTVPGILDPTAVVFEEAGPPATGASEGAVFVSDGSAGLTLGNLYFRGPSSAVPSNIGGGSGVSLADTLVIGNTTNGTDIIVSAADTIQMGSSPAAAVSSAGTGRLRYNNISVMIESSLDGGVWTALNGQFQPYARLAQTTNVASLAGGAPNPVDSVTPSVGDRIYVTGQSTASQNGMYQVTVVGTGVDGTWVRAADAPAGAANVLFPGTSVFISEGSTDGLTRFVLMNTGVVTVGSTSLTFYQEAPLVRTDASSTSIIAPTAFISGTIIWSSAVDTRDYSEVSVWFNPAVLGSNTVVDLYVQWSDDGSTIPFDDDNGIQQTDFLLSSGTDGTFKLKNYVARLTTATGELVAGAIKLLTFPKRGGSMRFGVLGDDSSGTFAVRAQRLA